MKRKYKNKEKIKEKKRGKGTEKKRNLSKLHISLSANINSPAGKR